LSTGLSRFSENSKNALYYKSTKENCPTKAKANKIQGPLLRNVLAKKNQLLQ